MLWPSTYFGITTDDNKLFGWQPVDARIARISVPTAEISTPVCCELTIAPDSGQILILGASLVSSCDKRNNWSVLCWSVCMALSPGLSSEGHCCGYHNPPQPECIFAFTWCGVHAAAFVPYSTCVMSKQCFFAASQLQQLMMIDAKLRSFSLSRYSKMSASCKPSMIWSPKLFCAHVFKQNLQVLLSLHSAIKQSSNGPPACCLHLLKFHCSTVSFTWPSM